MDRAIEIGKKEEDFLIINNDVLLADSAILGKQGNGINIVLLQGEDIRTKVSFMNIVKRKQNFPSYFGGNWDAYNDSLRDELWKQAEKNEIYFLIVKNAENFLSDEEEREIDIFLQILSDIIKDMKEDKCPMRVKIVFITSSPENTLVEQILKKGGYSYFKE